MPLTAEIIAVGTELLLGNIANTDAQDISQGLSELGLNCFFHTTVGDNAERLKDALKTACSRADIIITTGGLGPTYDDITKQIVCDFFEMPLELHKPTWESITEYFERYGRTLTENNRQQAMLPVGGVILKNDWGTAPGCAFEAKGKHVLLLPGPPSECRPMFKSCAFKYLEKLGSNVLVSRNMRIIGMGESQLEMKLRDKMIEAKNPTIAPYAKGGEVLLRITAGAGSRQEAYDLTVPVVEELKRELGDLVYGIDVDTLEEVVLSLLEKRGVTLATAESCTGGLISSRLTSVPGASKHYMGGVCAYFTEMKEKLLGVTPEVLSRFGAVSRETAEEMARGVCRVTGAGIGVSVTGLAGPGGDGTDTPVGTVFVALYDAANDKCICEKGAFGDERHRVRQMAGNHALNMARLYLEKNYAEK